MQQLFLAPASQANLHTIARGIELELVGQESTGVDLEVLRGALDAAGRLRCWAMGEASRHVFKEMRPGDLVLFATRGTGAFNYTGEVAHTLESATLGMRLWTFTPGQPWDLIYFLKNVAQIHIDKRKLLTALGFGKNDPLAGVRHVKPDRLAKVLGRDGSLSDFLEDLGGRGVAIPMSESRGVGETKELPTFEKPSWLLPLIANVSALRKDPDHKERAHESLVEDLYKLLGYTPYEHIKHRQGWIDISIDGPRGRLVVTEVKRDWSLSHDDHRVVSQAFGYALQAGARYVVVTNGDYYALYDRERGLSLDTHFLGDLRITRLTSEGLGLIERLRKERVLGTGTV